MEGVPALFFPPGRASVGPFAQLISLPRAAKIILAINDRRHIAEGDSFEVRIDDPHAADAAQEVITSERGVTGRKPFELVAGKNLLHFSSQRHIEEIGRASCRERV